MRIQRLLKKAIDFLLLPIFMFALLILPIQAEEKTTVTWAVEYFPPLYILEGENKGKGTADRLLNLLEDEMNEFEHKRRLVPILRIIEELKARNQIACASFLHDPKTTEFAQYSEPLFAVPPQKLIISTSKWREIGSPNSVSIRDIFSSGELNIGLGTGRNYGRKLTKIIDHYKDNNSKLYFRVGDHFNGLADMIIHDRIDATIAYGGEAKYYLSQSNNPDAFVHIPIEENDKALLVYVVMPKSVWGDKFLKHVNEAIFNLRLRPEYMEAIDAWFGHTDKFDFAMENLIEHSKLHAQKE